MVSLEALEGVLSHRARALGADIRIGREVARFSESVEGISVQAGDDQFERLIQIPVLAFHLPQPPGLAQVPSKCLKKRKPGARETIKILELVSRI